MRFNTTIKIKQIPLYFFLIFFCYSFVFRYVFRSYADEIAVIVIIPVLSLVTNKGFRFYAYQIPMVLMFVLILLWSTEAHKTYLYYFIMVEAILFIRPEVTDVDLIFRVIKRTALVNAISVLLTRAAPGVMTAYANAVFSRDIAYIYTTSLSKGYYSGINNEVAFTAVYLALGILICMYESRKISVGRIVELGILWLAFLATNKRGHLVFLLITILIVYYVVGTKNKKIERGIKIVFAALILVAVLIGASYLFPSIPIFRRLVSVFSLFTDDADLNAVSSGRINIYNQEIELFLSHKVWGIGWQNFADYSKSRDVSGYISQGHNVFLQLLCETGIVGFVLFFAINLYYLVQCLRVNAERLRENRAEINNDAESHLIAGNKTCLGFIVFYYLTWLTGNSLYDSVFVYIWVVAIMITQSLRRDIKGTPT